MNSQEATFSSSEMTPIKKQSACVVGGEGGRGWRAGGENGEGGKAKMTAVSL